MPIDKRTTVDRVEIDRDGKVSVRFALELVENGKVLHSSYHRSGVFENGEAEAGIADVSRHIESRGYPAVDTDLADKVRNARAIFRPGPGGPR